MNGRQFEKQLKASMERAGFSVWKLGGETPWARVGSGGDDGDDQAPRFTVKPPWDMSAARMRSPGDFHAVALGWMREMKLPEEKAFDLAHLLAAQSGACSVSIECKRTSGKSLQIARVKDHQVKNLVKAGDAGITAGLMVYMPDADADACWFIPIGEWIVEVETTTRKSVPFSKISEIGVRVAVDPTIGRTLIYFSAKDLVAALAPRITESLLPF